ncbi:MAG: DNA sulfur modification protein DndB [Chloroflexales bacterium]|nr:DNA sulfur modification protein DndB [Chloroflexales bacterium]
MSHYTFPAIWGHQGKYDYYLIQCSLQLLSRLFLFNEAEIPVNIRQMRTIDEAIIVEWIDYLSSHKNDYTLFPLVAVVDKSVTFESCIKEMPEIGRIQIPMSARLILCDGQHRQAAIKSLLTQNAALGNDTIAVMLIPDPDLDRVVDLYIKCHQRQIQSTRSKRVLHDPSDLATLVRQVVDEAPLFQGLTELEKTTISNRSTALFTLSAVYQATQALLNIDSKDVVSTECAKIVREFWWAMGGIIPEWRQIINREVTASYLRQNYVHSHTVTLFAIGMVGHELLAHYPEDWRERLMVLGDIDWSRDNKALWEGRSMVRGKMNKSRDSITLTVSALKRLLGLELTKREIELEEVLSNL